MTSPNPPIIRRIEDLDRCDALCRKTNCTELDPPEIEACKECPKPVWFTAFFDGTGNSFYRDDGKHEGKDRNKYLGPKRDDGAQGEITDGMPDEKNTYYSNIAKLAKFAHEPDNDADGKKKVRSRYIPGVGAPCMYDGVNDGGGFFEHKLGMGMAYKGEARIRWMLRELREYVDNQVHFVSRVNLAVFGFSRGATQARAFVRMLVTEKLAEEVSGKLYWRGQNMNKERPEVVIYFMGLFDTVASVGYGGGGLETWARNLSVVAGRLHWGGFLVSGALWAIDKGGHAEWAKDISIPGYVRQCVHYVACHEVREKFPSDSVRVGQEIPSNCVEVFYPGTHCDVGGSYKHEEQEKRLNTLANIALNNMFIDAWNAGVPLKCPNDVMKQAGSQFEILPELEQHWNDYMGQGGAGDGDRAPDSDELKENIIWHMDRYYKWRIDRFRRLNTSGDPLHKNKENKKDKDNIDDYMKITDKEWEEDISRIKWENQNRGKLKPHENVILEAYLALWRDAWPSRTQSLLRGFFDTYVHDSIASFKDLMMSEQAGIAENSRWAINRVYFMGNDFPPWYYGIDEDQKQ